MRVFNQMPLAKLTMAAFYGSSDVKWIQVGCLVHTEDYRKDLLILCTPSNQLPFCGALVQILSFS